MAIKIEDFIKELKEMKVIDLNKLVKAIEEEFGVSAAAPAAPAAENSTENSTEVDVVLIHAGQNKIAVIKLIRDVMGLALMDAKKFSDNGGVIKEALEPEAAEELVAKFKEVGADIETK